MGKGGKIVLVVLTDSISQNHLKKLKKLSKPPLRLLVDDDDTSKTERNSETEVSSGGL